MESGGRGSDGRNGPPPADVHSKPSLEAAVMKPERKLAARLRAIGVDATFIRFAAVGATTTVIDIALFAGLTIGAGLSPAVANIVSYTAAFVVSFALNRTWTFGLNSSSRVEHHAVRFAVTNIGALAISTLLVALLAFAVPKVAAKTLSLPPVFLWNYLLSRWWVFR